MGNPAVDKGDHFSYRQYRTWPDEERWELIDGQAWAMSPAPLRLHQEISHRLVVELAFFLKGKPCKMYEAPFDVLLPKRDEPDDEVDTVVQPDIVVYCDKSKLTRNGARGAPDIAVEILSARSSKKDLNEKFRLYERHGVREYWVVDPGNEAIQLFRMKPEGGFDEGELRDTAHDLSPISSDVLEGFAIDPQELFSGE